MQLKLSARNMNIADDQMFLEDMTHTFGVLSIQHQARLSSSNSSYAAADKALGHLEVVLTILGEILGVSGLNITESKGYLTPTPPGLLTFQGCRNISKSRPQGMCTCIMISQR